MPHAVEVWDRSDSDSDTNPPLTLEQLGLESDTDSENEQIEQTEIQKKQKKKKKKPNQKSLQARGYLFEDKVDIDNIMDPTDMGLQVLQARRKGRMEFFKAPVRYMETIKNKLADMAGKREGRPTLDSEHWGDKPVYRDSWPKVETKGCIRVMFYNVHGISALEDFIEMEMLMQTAAQEQADIIMITEINLNMHVKANKYRLIQAVKQYDKYAKVQIAHPPENPNTTRSFNMGGNMIIVQGALAGRIGEQGSDALGRWSWMELKCDGDQSLILTCAYRVGKSKGSVGGTSIAQQEIRALLKTKHELATKPRAAFNQDFANFSTKLQNEGKEVLLLMDANTPINSAENRSFLTSAGLEDVAMKKHPNLDLPRSYQAGSNCIDETAASKLAMSWVKAFGFFSFFQHGLYDHRGQVLDLDCKLFLKNFKPDLTKRVNHKLKASRPSEAEAYCKQLRKLLTKSGVFEKIDELYQGLYTANRDEQVKRFKRVQIYNDVARDLMIAAENKLGPKSPMIQHWSPILKKKGQELSYYNECIKADAANNDLGITVTVPKSVTRDESVLSREDLESKRLEVKLSWNQATKQKATLRKSFLQEQAIKATETRNIEYASALKQIINAETSRALHERHGGLLNKDKNRGGIKSILVPRPGSDLALPGAKPDDGWDSIDNDTWINALFASINRRKLCMSNGSTMAPGGILYDIIGPYGTSDGADEILKGTFDVETLTPIGDIDIVTLKEFVRQMARPTSDEGIQAPDLEWKFEADEYRDAFSKKNEATSCGPSGLHMSHWKVICDDQKLCELFAKFIEIPFKLGLTYSRWETSFHTMIMKKTKPWANAMRIVQILEGDYNAGLRFLVQRCVTKHAEKHHIFGESTYGGRKGKNTHQVLGRIQATNEYCRIGRIPAALADVDAKNCFDCMTHAGIGFFQRRQGSTKDLVNCQCTNLHNMKHYIKTGRGVAKDPIKPLPDKTLEGSGQGSGASVGNWQGHNDPMILTFEKLCRPCSLATPDGRDRLRQWIVSFVDDNKIMMNFDVDATVQQIYRDISTGIKTWRDILRITGGELELDKSYIGILSFNFDTFKSEYMGKHSHHKVGVPLLVSSAEHEETVTLDQGGRKIILQELEPDEGLRLLGIRMSLSGDFSDEFYYRRKQVQEMAVKVRSAALDARDGWLIYQTRFRPMLRYCLPITTFTMAECKQIQSPFIGAFINCLGLNRNTKRAVCHGPFRFGGLSIMDVGTEQFASRMHLMMTNIRKGNPTGRSIVHALSMYQMYLGCEKPFLELDPSLYPTLPSTTHSAQYLWEQLRSIGGKLNIPSMWVPTSNRKNDRTVMDAFVNTMVTRKGTPSFLTMTQLYQANACRLYLKVTWVSDISNYRGNRIAPWAFLGTARNRTELVYPHQERPPESAWKVWRLLLRSSLIAVKNQQVVYSNYPLITPVPIGAEAPAACHEFTTADADSPLQTIIDGMTASWKQVLGDVVIPEDEGKQMAEILSNGGTLKMWSDGTVKNGIGAHAYTVRTLCEDTDAAILGDAVTPGNPADISSLRSESYGGLACLILTWALEYKYGTNGGYVLLHIDNQEVVNRIKYGVPDEMAAEKFTKTDFDVWNEASELAKKLKATVCAKWVKGHQDKHIEGVYSGIGPISLGGKFNILMDRRAEKRRLKSSITHHTIAFLTERATLRVNNSIVTTHISDYITYAKTAPPMIKYLKEKNDWSDETFNKVDWAAMQTYMGQISVATRAKVVKLQHNWQNTGRQKGLFLASAGASSAAVQDAAKCPMGCGEYEAPLHFLCCTKNPRMDETKLGIRGIRKWLKRQDTAPVLISIIIRILYKATQDKTEELGEWNFTNERDEASLRAIVDDQEEIGWSNFFKGRMAKEWGVVQGQYYNTLDLPESQAYKTGVWWTANLIRQITYFSLNQWQIRNDFLHKEKVETVYNQERSELRKRMRWWYRQESKMSRAMKKYFKKTFLERGKECNQNLACWIDTLEAHYKYAVEKGDELARVEIPKPRESHGG